MSKENAMKRKLSRIGWLVAIASLGFPISFSSGCSKKQHSNGSFMEKKTNEAKTEEESSRDLKEQLIEIGEEEVMGVPEVEDSDQIYDEEKAKGISAFAQAAVFTTGTCLGCHVIESALHLNYVSGLEDIKNRYDNVEDLVAWLDNTTTHGTGGVFVGRPKVAILEKDLKVAVARGILMGIDKIDYEGSPRDFSHYSEEAMANTARVASQACSSCHQYSSGASDVTRSGIQSKFTAEEVMLYAAAPGHGVNANYALDAPPPGNLDKIFLKAVSRDLKTASSSINWGQALLPGCNGCH